MMGDKVRLPNSTGTGIALFSSSPCVNARVANYVDATAQLCTQ